MIPKVIHYCWFGGNPLPASALICINSWKKFFPDYEIKEWNESNFDVNFIPFTQEAYAAKKYAFVSDVARFWILAQEGGLYFDTDVEVIKDFDDILADGPFLGVEIPSQEGQVPQVNPGLGLGAECGNAVIQSVLNYYKTKHFHDENGVPYPGTVVYHTTEVLKSEYALQPNNEIQHLKGMTIYPMDYFNPFDDLTGVLRKTVNTHSIHWYSKTWIEKPSWYFAVTRVLHRLFGTKTFTRAKSMGKK